MRVWIAVLGMMVAGPLQGPVVLTSVPAVSHGVAAFPRLAVGPGVTAEVAAKVNAGLKRLDASVGAAALDCRTSFKEQQHKSGADAWGRTVEVTMRGPRYLSLVATDSYYCGGPYPNDGLLLPLVYDLTTGRPVDWVAMLPKGAKGELSNSADGAKVGVVTWPALAARSRQQAEGDCKGAFDGDTGPVSYVLWLDGSKGEVVAQPFSFPHAMAACADELRIPVAEARKMGFAGELVDALEAAKKLQR